MTQMSPGLPPDAALPRLARVLDPDEITPVLQRCVGNNAVAGIRIGTVNYQPGRRLVVRYEVSLDDAVHDVVGMIDSNGKLARLAALPENDALADAAAARSPVARPLVYEASLDCLLQWLPLDTRLPALAEPTDRLRSRLRAAGAAVRPREGEPSLLAYRPRRHAVLRLGRHVLRVYSTDRAVRTGTFALRFYSAARAIPTPRLEAVVPELRLTVQTLLPGKPQRDAAASAARAGAVLSRLHGTPVFGRLKDGMRVALPTHQLDRAARTARFLAVVSPTLRGRLHALVERLAATTPTRGALVPCHGDFSVAQLLQRGSELAVVDLDRLCLAPDALDAATYCAHLVRGRPRDLDLALAVLEDLVAGYGRRPSDLSWYLSSMILRRASRPLRYMDADWHAGVAEMLAAANAALES
jgi:hypothetical protein